jgi:hypothetical protein
MLCDLRYFSYVDRAWGFLLQTYIADQLTRCIMNDGECSICLTGLANGEETAALMCGHVYHSICLSTYADTVKVTMDQLRCAVCKRCPEDFQGAERSSQPRPPLPRSWTVATSPSRDSPIIIPEGPFANPEVDDTAKETESTEMAKETEDLPAAGTGNALDDINGTADADGGQ